VRNIEKDKLKLKDDMAKMEDEMSLTIESYKNII
jgi:hypothetical protein